MTPRKPIIYGPDGHPIVRARDRHAPKPRKHAGLEGWVSWGLVDRSGHVVKGGEQHNLILDTFLERIAADNLANFHLFLSHFAVGTGSAAPDVEDVALTNEIARTTTQTFYEISRPSNGVYLFELEREFDFADANGNLTEFGLSYGAGADLLVRELFRDGGGDPITVTKTSDYKLRIRYALTVTLTPAALTPFSVNITGIGLISGDYALVGGSTTGGAQMTDVNNLFSFAAGSTPAVILELLSSWSYTSGGNYNSSAPAADSESVEAYTPGSHTRKMSYARFSTSRGNVAGIRSITLASAATGNGRRFMQYLIDEEDAFTKDDQHTLELLEPLTFAWGRA